MRKEMIYQTEKKEEAEVLATGFCFGLLYYILSLGTYPAAYIKIPKNNKFYGKEAIGIDINVHGGITYTSEGLYINNGKEVEGWYIGWDYADLGDYLGWEDKYVKGLAKGKKWTTDEIFAEVREACYQIQSTVKVEKDVYELIGQKEGLVHSLEYVMTIERIIRKDLESIDNEINKRLGCEEK